MNDDDGEVKYKVMYKVGTKVHRRNPKKINISYCRRWINDNNPPPPNNRWNGAEEIKYYKKSLEY